MGVNRNCTQKNTAVVLSLNGRDPLIHIYDVPAQRGRSIKILAFCNLVIVDCGKVMDMRMNFKGEIPVFDYLLLTSYHDKIVFKKISLSTFIIHCPLVFTMHTL